MITLGHMLVLSGILFALSVAGIFINRRNVLLMLMCIELLLLAAMLLLVAIIAAISLTLRKRRNLKVQDIAAQVAVRAQDRVRIVKMEPERKP